MITCFIVDDEPLVMDGLEKMIKRYCPHLNIVGKASTLEKAIEGIRSLRPQLVFLDIQMPRGNAFDLLDQLMPVDFEIIFVTAFDNFALRAFKYSALGYLLKPVDMNELKMVVQKAQQRIEAQDTNHQLNNFLHNFQNKRVFSKIGLRTKDGIILYPIEEILYCSAERAYTKFSFIRNKNLLVIGILKEFESLLPEDCFCRVHDSYLINLNHVTKYHNGKGGYVEMTDGQVIEVSLRKRADFLSRLRY